MRYIIYGDFAIAPPTGEPTNILTCSLRENLIQSKFPSDLSCYAGIRNRCTCQRMVAEGWSMIPVVSSANSFVDQVSLAPPFSGMLTRPAMIYNIRKEIGSNSSWYIIGLVASCKIPEVIELERSSGNLPLSLFHQHRITMRLGRFSQDVLTYLSRTYLKDHLGDYQNFFHGWLVTRDFMTKLIIPSMFCILIAIFRFLGAGWLLD